MCGPESSAAATCRSRRATRRNRFIYYLGQSGNTRQWLCLGRSGESADELFGGYSWFHDPAHVQAGTFPWSVPKIDMARRCLDPGLIEKLDLPGYLDERYRRALAEAPALAGLHRPNPPERRIRQVCYLFLTRFLVSDHGTEFTCNAMLAWCKDAAIDWHFIAPRKPMQNGFVESFMYRRIWTPPDCNDRLDQDRRSQLQTYIRLLDAAGQRLRREPRWFSPASTSTAPRHRRKPCRSTHQVREATGVTVSPSPAICCNCRVRPPFLDCRFVSGRLHRQRWLISCVACEHSSHDPRVLVGKSHGRDIGIAPLPDFAEPEASRILLASGPA